MYGNPGEPSKEIPTRILREILANCLNGILKRYLQRFLLEFILDWDSLDIAAGITERISSKIPHEILLAFTPAVLALISAVDFFQIMDIRTGNSFEII